jgi:hypothetical protein
MEGVLRPENRVRVGRCGFSSTPVRLEGQRAAVLLAVTTPSSNPGPAPTAPPVAWLPTSPSIPDLAATDVPCLSCGYNLRGLSDSGRCPECGTPIVRSLMGNLLEFSSANYIESLRRGATIVKASILLSIISTLLLLLLSILNAAVVTASGALHTAIQTAYGVAAVVCLGSSVAFYAGWWLLSDPDPAIVGSETGATHRRVLRVTAAAGAATTALSSVAQLGAPAPASAAMPGGVIGTITMAAGIAGTIAWIVMYFASMRYARWLAPRLPDPWVDARAKLLTWLGPVLYIFGCGVGAIVALVFYWNLVERIRAHLSRIRETQTNEAPQLS